MFITLQHHVSKLSRHFSSPLWSDKVSVLYKTIHQIAQLTSFFLKFRSNFLVIRELYMLNAAFAMEILGLISGTRDLFFNKAL
jgi:hypothetical protein